MLPGTLTPSPHRAKLLRLRLLPTAASPSNENFAPPSSVPWTEIDEPKRATVRTDTFDPHVAKSSIERQAPNRTWLLQLKLEPRLRLSTMETPESTTAGLCE
jgi:hypothetical protein